MKLKNHEILIICVTAACILFTVGFFVGRGSAETTVQLQTIVEEKNEQNTENSLPKIDLNTADQEHLCTLPGVGEAIAERILSYREENGDFSSIEELKNVSGIGEKVFEGLRDRIAVE